MLADSERQMPEQRSPERVRAHYEIEVELADRLRQAAPAQRRELYGTVYDELFQRVPDHPQLTRRSDAGDRARYAGIQVDLIRQFLPLGGSYVELGAGDCATARGLLEHAGRVTAVEVSEEIIPDDVPAAVAVAISDGVSVPVPESSADVVYSNQLMEHLHPDDATAQLTGVARALKAGGRYIVITPNRLSGPHDVSRSFDDVARGFHLKEYTYRELSDLLREAGFRRVKVFQRLHGRTLSRIAKLAGGPSSRPGRALERFGDRALVLPLWPFLALERVAALAPRRLGHSSVFGRALGLHVIAER
ncbi:MAG TPA: class I SAM-dependent methyltransferase [Solirubrobacteraceae bacterium]|jgi:SAM-dependent methyltransferase|nr:class I SAM-dependent methyltransferase [Solirubrobacteraceae bacterium]